MGREIPELLPRIDRAGRLQKDPKRLGHGIGWATALANWLPPHRVPPEFWSQDVDDDDLPVAIVACPCGCAPVAPLLGPIVPCDCGRGFFFGGPDVWAFRPSPDEPTQIAA